MEIIACPFCGDSEQEFATSENGYILVRCKSCRLLFVSPGRGWIRSMRRPRPGCMRRSAAV